MQIRGSKLIDSIVAIPRTLEVVEGCKSLESNDIVITVHRGYIININFKSYFEENFS